MSEREPVQEQVLLKLGQGAEREVGAVNPIRMGVELDTGGWAMWPPGFQEWQQGLEPRVVSGCRSCQR